MLDFGPMMNCLVVMVVERRVTIARRHTGQILGRYAICRGVWDKAPRILRPGVQGTCECLPCIDEL
jgi:hypothetical protein